MTPASALRATAVVVAIAALPIAARATDTFPALTGPQVGAAAPPFSLPIVDGKRVTLASFAGKVLVLNVWATWCPPCRMETPDLIAAEANLRGTGVAFLGVDTTETAPIVRAFASARRIVYPLALDRDKKFSKAYDVAYFPTTYVIDARGVLRARYIDVLGAPQLAALVRDAKAGRDAEIASPLQANIDATLADPSLAFAPGDDAASTRATAARVDVAIASAESLLDQSDAAHGNATDLLRTRAEEAALRDRALAVLGADDSAFVARMRGDSARDRERWGEALDAYTAALVTDPNDPRALAGVAFAAGRLDRYDTVIDADSRLVARDPSDVGALVDLARTQAKAGKRDDASATYARASSVARAYVDAHPRDPVAIRMAAYAHLYAGRTFALAGDAPRARGEFERTLAFAARLPARDARHDMYLEEGQEALVALSLAARRAGATVSLVPWTGAVLPGSIPGTRKFRLVVAGTRGRSVALRTTGVPKGWVASFCSDLVCAPFRTTVTLPQSGVKVVEFQLVPPNAAAATPRIRVISTDGAHESSATT